MQDPHNLPRDNSFQLMSAEIEDDGNELKKYLAILRRRWLTIVLVTLLSAGVTIFFTLRITKIYRATTTVRIETQAPKVLGRDVEAVDELGTGSFWSNAEYYETQYKILASRDVASRVVKELKLNEDPIFLNIPQEEMSEFEPVSIDEAAQVLQLITTIEPVKDSRLVLVHVDSPDPHRAQLYSQALAKAYSDKNLESMLQSTLDAADWLSKQVDDAQHKLEEADHKVYEYKRENDILSISLEERQNIITAQMTAAATSLTEARARRIELRARKDAIESIVYAEDPYAEEPYTEDPLSIPLEALNNNGLVQQLKQEYGKLKQEYGELSARYGDKFPRMVELKAKIERIRRDIKREVENVLRAVDTELAAAKSTEAGLQRTLEQFRRQAINLSEKEAGYYTLVREKENNEKIYSLLLGRSKEAGLSRLLRVNNIHILDPALLPEKPIKPRLVVNLMVSVVVGLLLGLGLALIIEFGDRTLKTQDEVDALGVAFLGIIPDMDVSAKHSGEYRYAAQDKKGRGKKKHRGKKKSGNGAEPINYDLYVRDFPKSQVAESCRSIRTNLLFMSADEPAKRILITSPSPQEGKTTVTMNLAVAMAQSGSRVLLVDTDMRRPRIHNSFGLKPKVGLSTLVLGESTVDEAIRKTEIENLDVLMCGPTPPNPAELMLTETFVRVIEEVNARYDRVLFDSPPVGVVTDAAILSKLVDGTVLIFKSLSTTRDSAKHAIGVLRDIDSNILGAVLNNLDLSDRKYGRYYYNYYYRKYGYYYNADDSHGEPKPPSKKEKDRPHDTV